jgi:DNA-binding transcriptional LysR family regulator
VSGSVHFVSLCSKPLASGGYVPAASIDATSPNVKVCPGAAAMSRRSNSIVALRRYVRATLGVAIIGAGVAAAAEIERGEVVMLDIDHAICRKAKLRLITRRARPLSPAASRLLATMRNRLASFGESARS